MTIRPMALDRFVVPVGFIHWGFSLGRKVETSDAEGYTSVSVFVAEANRF
jgi:hypothetical protein